MAKAWRRRPAPDGGFTVIEVSIAAALTVASLAIVSTFLVSAQRTVSIEQMRSSSNDESRLAMEQVDREVRSSNFILPLDPYTLIVETQNNAPTPTNNCVLWSLVDGQLLRRSWQLFRPEDATGWRVVATGVVNRELDQPLFELPDTPANRRETGGFTVDVAIYVNPNLEKNPDSTVVVRQSLTGRNVAAKIVPAGLPWPPTEPSVQCKDLPTP